MSDVKVHRVKYRLARQLRAGAQLSVTTALGGAKDRVKKLEPAILAAIDDEIAGMDAAVSDLGRGDAAMHTLGWWFYRYSGWRRHAEAEAPEEAREQIQADGEPAGRMVPDV